MFLREPQSTAHRDSCRPDGISGIIMLGWKSPVSFHLASFAVSEEGVERDQHKLMGKQTQFQPFELWKKLAGLEESWSWAPEGGSSSVVPICDNQGVHLNPLNTTSPLPFPLSSGMFRLFVSYLFLIIHIFITFPSSGFIWKCFQEFGFFAGSRVSVGFLNWCPGALSITKAWQQELSQKSVELSHPSGWVSIPWKPRQEQPERNSLDSSPVNLRIAVNPD